MPDDQDEVVSKIAFLESYTDCSHVPEEKMITLAKVSVAIESYVKEYDLDCVTIRCWTEMQSVLGIAPCVLLSEMNDRGLVASCEIDLCSAISMYALQLAAQEPAACLDWNNNYGEGPR